jgi:hypothetical protein
MKRAALGIVPTICFLFVEDGGAIPISYRQTYPVDTQAITVPGTLLDVDVFIASQQGDSSNEGFVNDILVDSNMTISASVDKMKSQPDIVMFNVLHLLNTATPVSLPVAVDNLEQVAAKLNDSTRLFTGSAILVSEPATLSLAGIGLIGLILWSGRKKLQRMADPSPESQ